MTADVYYELCDSMISKFDVDGHKYLVLTVTQGLSVHSYDLMKSSDRVWLDDGKKIQYIKNRFNLDAVDLKEFMWIKLSSFRMDKYSNGAIL